MKYFNYIDLIPNPRALQTVRTIMGEDAVRLAWVAQTPANMTI